MQMIAIGVTAELSKEETHMSRKNLESREIQVTICYDSFSSLRKSSIKDTNVNKCWSSLGTEEHS